MAILRGAPLVHSYPGCSKQLGKVLKQLGARHVFLCTDAMLVKVGVVEKICAIIKADGLSTTIFDAVLPNPTASSIDAGVLQLQACPAGTVVVSLGGGSVMDAAKCIQVVSGQGAGASVMEFVAIPSLKAGSDNIDLPTLVPKKQPGTNVPKIIAVPTTSGTGSETNGAAVVTEDGSHKKVFFVNDLARASAVLLDPELTTGLPPYPTASCGMDVLAHALEAFTSNRTNDYSDGLAIAAIRLVVQWLPRAVAEPANVEARGKMQMASFMAASAFDSAQLGLMHATGHQLTSLYGEPHGQTLATMMPHVMWHNIAAGKALAKYAQVAVAFGVHDPLLSELENARRAVEAVARFSTEVGTSKSIEAMGGSEQDVPELAQRALLDVSRLFGQEPATRAALETMYRAALRDEKLYPSSAPRARL